MRWGQRAGDTFSPKKNQAEELCWNCGGGESSGPCLGKLVKGTFFTNELETPHLSTPRLTKLVFPSGRIANGASALFLFPKVSDRNPSSGMFSKAKNDIVMITFNA